MNAQQRIMATLAGAFVSLFMGYIMYALVFENFFATNVGSASGVMKTDDMVWWALILGNVFMAYLLVYIFGKWANISTLSGGFMAGGMIGLIMGFGFDLISYGTSNIMNLTGALVDPFVFAIMMAATGGVIGWMLGRGK
jgi:hypothetical protein